MGQSKRTQERRNSTLFCHKNTDVASDLKWFIPSDLNFPNDKEDKLMDQRQGEPKLLKTAWMVSKEIWCVVQIRMQKKRKAICSVIAVKASLFLVMINNTLNFLPKASFTEHLTTLQRVKVSVIISVICHFDTI